jgi:hypothetical protein
MPRLSKFGAVFYAWQYVANPACLDCDGEEVHGNWGSESALALSHDQLSSRISNCVDIENIYDSAIIASQSTCVTQTH